MKMVVSWYVFMIVLLSSGAAIGAGDEIELKRLQAILAVINQELQATYQQYQLVVEARRDSLSVRYYTELAPMGEPQDYEKVMQERISAYRRDQRLADQLDRFLDKIAELEAKKRPILQRVYQLMEEGARTPTPGPPPEGEPSTPLRPSY